MLSIKYFVYAKLIRFSCKQACMCIEILAKSVIGVLGPNLFLKKDAILRHAVNITLFLSNTR